MSLLKIFDLLCGNFSVIAEVYFVFVLFHLYSPVKRKWHYICIHVGDDHFQFFLVDFLTSSQLICYFFETTKQNNWHKARYATAQQE